MELGSKLRLSSYRIRIPPPHRQDVGEWKSEKHQQEGTNQKAVTEGDFTGEGGTDTQGLWEQAGVA